MWGQQTAVQEKHMPPLRSRSPDSRGGGIPHRPQSHQAVLGGALTSLQPLTAGRTLVSPPAELDLGVVVETFSKACSK